MAAGSLAGWWFGVLTCVALASGHLDTELTGVLDDCFCDIESIDSFNNFKIYPRIQRLTERDFFRYYRCRQAVTGRLLECRQAVTGRLLECRQAVTGRLLECRQAVNLKRPCPFWPDDGHCSHRDCNVEPCPESKIPVGIKSGNFNKATDLGAINNTLSNQSKEAFVDWDRHDDAQDHFCELDDESSPDAAYVDLLLNPERYTGYQGPSAWRVWNSIYEENCFKPRSVYRPLNPLAPSR
ncbi:hypothetical protein CRUP_002617, partial [Coryphaenoides rupestris]